MSGDKDIVDPISKMALGQGSSAILTKLFGMKRSPD
jgi:hypothetical protein